MQKKLIVMPAVHVEHSIDKLFLKVSPQLPLTLLMGLYRQPTDISVLFWFMVIIGEDVPLHMPGWVNAPHAYLSEDLKLDRRNVRRAITRLIEVGVLCSLKKGMTAYRLNPNLISKGNAEELRKRYEESNKSPFDYTVLPKLSTRKQIRVMLAHCKQYREKWGEGRQPRARALPRPITKVG
jgi:hypothetical protein